MWCWAQFACYKGWDFGYSSIILTIPTFTLVIRRKGVNGKGWKTGFEFQLRDLLSHLITETERSPPVVFSHSKWRQWWTNSLSIRIACLCVLSRVWLFVTPWTVAHQAPLSIGFYRQEDCSGLPFPTPRDLSDTGIETSALASPAFGRQVL